jgi:predicted permease
LEEALLQFGPGTWRDCDCGAILHEEARHKARALREKQRRWKFQISNLKFQIRKTADANPALRLEASMSNVIQDFRYALRMLRKSAGFSIVAILTLAIGIGASTAIFSLLDQILLRRLPVQKPEQLVVLRSPGDVSGSRWGDGGPEGQTFSYPMFKALREKNEALSGLLARYITSVSVSYQGDTELAECELISGNYFEVLGVRPALGRVFSMNDEQAPGANPVVVLSYGYWQRHFGGNPQVLNQSVPINGTPMTVVGVAQAGFKGVQAGESPDVFIPLTMAAQAMPNEWALDKWDNYWLPLIGRLKPGMSMQQAQASLQVTYHALVTEQAAQTTKWASEARKQQFIDRKMILMPGSQGRPTLQNDAQAPLLALGGMVILVLLIVCTNVASLLMARGASRSREYAIRRALGADRMRLVRAVLIESLMLALAGGLAGLIVAVWGIDTLTRIASSGQGIEGLSSSLDLRILIFNFAVAVGTGILFGLAPALRFSGGDLNAVLRDQDRSSTSGSGHVRIRKVFVAAQMALTVLLLTGAALMTQTLWNLRNEDLGLKADHMVQFTVSPALNGYTPARTAAFTNQLTDALAALPGVRGVSASQVSLLSGTTNNGGVEIEGKIRNGDPEEQRVSQNRVGPNFFSTVGVPLLAGREFSASDASDGPKVAIVNETFVKQYLADRNPVGARFGFGTGNGVKSDIEIVGVVKDEKYAHVREDKQAFAFSPLSQDKTQGFATFYVRTTQPPESFFAVIRDTVRKIDPSLPTAHMKTEEAVVAEDLSGEAIVAGLSLTFGSVAALLGCIGIYGVLAFLVVQRTREIGIRIALGAMRGDIGRLVLREAVVLVAIGVAIGVPAAYGLGRLMDSMLYGVSAGQPLTLLAGPALMAVVALAAAYIPVRRATRVDPMVALRYE